MKRGIQTDHHFVLDMGTKWGIGVFYAWINYANTYRQKPRS